MATVINAYKTGSYLDAYSKDGANDDPVFAYPPNDFDGDAGQTRDVQLFFRNDGTTYLRENVASLVDKAALGREVWMKLSLTEGGLASATPGASLTLPDLDPSQTVLVWERMTVPASTTLANVTDLTVRLQSKVYDS